MNSIAQLALVFIAGIAVGLLPNLLSKSKKESKSQPTQGTAHSSAQTTRSSSSSASFQEETAYFWYPENVTAFQHPKTKQERDEIIRLVRAGLENEKSLPRRMKAVSEFCELMTPENAHAMRDAFNQSLEAGYNGAWERSIFFARYGEVLGAEGANEFMGDVQFPRIAASFALERPDEAAKWVNELPPGKDRDMAVNRVMYGVGLYSPSYAFDLFESLAPEDQNVRLNRVNLISAARRSGGIESLNELTQKALSKPTPPMQKLAKAGLNEAFSVFQGNEEGLHRWLDQLPHEHLILLERGKLPKVYREKAQTPQSAH